MLVAMSRWPLEAASLARGSVRKEAFSATVQDSRVGGNSSVNGRIASVVHRGKIMPEDFGFRAGRAVFTDLRIAPHPIVEDAIGNL